MDADTPLSGVVVQSNCRHTSDSYIATESGFAAQQWQNTGQALPVVVGTIGALSVPSFTPSLIAVCLTGCSLAPWFSQAAEKTMKNHSRKKCLMMNLL